MGHARGMRTLATLVFLAASSSALARAEAPETLRVEPPGPAAIYVDGVKIGAELPALPKQAPVRAGRCTSSGCTLIVTY